MERLVAEMTCKVLVGMVKPYHAHSVTHYFISTVNILVLVSGGILWRPRTHLVKLVVIYMNQ